MFQPCAASSWNEKKTIIYPLSDIEKTCLLQPDQSISTMVSLEQNGTPMRRFLRVVGKGYFPVPFQKRGESTFRLFENLIDDNLDSIIRKRDRYSLYFKGENDYYERHAYYRISGEVLKAGELTVSLPVVKRNSLSISSDGDFGVTIELFYKKVGRSADDIYDTPDSLLYMPVPVGTDSYRVVSQMFVLPENIACALLRVGGTRFSGECWVEAPRLIQNKKEICSIPFVRYFQRDDQHNYWVGCNMATRCWPMWKLEFSGKVVFQGNVFDRASNIADFYIPLPDSICGTGELKLILQKEPYRTTYPYEIHRLEIIEETARDFEVISVPKYVVKNAAFGVLIETNKPDVCLKVHAKSGSMPLLQEYVFKEAGLHVIELRAGEAGYSIPLILESGERTEQVQVCQVIDKEVEQIYLSCGDDIYVDKQDAFYDNFFKWYFSNRVGNWYQFRPSYQWSGSRIFDPIRIKYYTELLDRLKVPYAWQVEGRTLAGSRLNPPSEILASSMFRGKQAHENDGGYYYWKHFRYKGLFSDMAARNRPYGGIFAKHRPIYTDHGTFIHYDPFGVKDMADGASKLVRNFRYSKGSSIRHTGPSTLFRYLYQAGYEWLGAEQMYGPDEIIISSLRGASRAYSRPLYGTLHAMQWGAGSFTDPKHALRHYMSLAVAYMHGSSHINTEDALWTDEFGNDRYSVSGKAHMFAQHQMLDFLETHTRRGNLKSNVAVIQGRNDAWCSFERGSLWSQEGDKWKFNKACESFDLLNVFYPDNIVNYCGPEGWFTSTPYGTVDLLPIEAPLDVMKQYKAMIFLGWNSFYEADFQRIGDFVFNGGTLLLSAAHINEELQPDKPVCFPSNDWVIRQMLGDDYRQLTKKTEIVYGSGKVIYFPQKLYPAESGLRSDYECTMREIAEELVSKETNNGWINPGSSVEFTVWDAKDRRTIYLLNTDWKSDADWQTATFVCDGKRFQVHVRRYHIETIHCFKGLAVMPLSNTTDILDVRESKKGWIVKVQNTEKDVIQCMKATTGNMISIDLKQAGIHNLFISKF